VQPTPPVPIQATSALTMESLGGPRGPLEVQLAADIDIESSLIVNESPYSHPVSLTSSIQDDFLTETP